MDLCLLALILCWWAELVSSCPQLSSPQQLDGSTFHPPPGLPRKLTDSHSCCMKTCFCFTETERSTQTSRWISIKEENSRNVLRPVFLRLPISSSELVGPVGELLLSFLVLRLLSDWEPALLGCTMEAAVVVLLAALCSTADASFYGNSLSLTAPRRNHNGTFTVGRTNQQGDTCSYWDQ